ncbi:16S rRNA (guanine(966)-N(2))-methyltransferase RsmD [Clostridiaceae bacterium M8S5]|nr:16S rRNA (guanine(966)-N(2))-methyltransferase RsmD [Clostridiaceae bacterium M8S5]
MRVITGKAKGHRLTAPNGIKTRPTTDKVKESIFNILGYIKEDDYILDLFSGSGGMGIEFLSRGANKCVFIDIDINAINVIKQNLKSTKLNKQAEVYKTDVKKAIRKLKERQIKFNFVFLDPPYNRDFVVTTLELIKKDILSDNAVIIVEHSDEEQIPELVEDLRVFDSRKYGNTCVTFLHKKEEIDDSSLSR